MSKKSKIKWIFHDLLFVKFFKNSKMKYFQESRYYLLPFSLPTLHNPIIDINPKHHPPQNLWLVDDDWCAHSKILFRLQNYLKQFHLKLDWMVYVVLHTNTGHLYRMQLQVLAFQGDLLSDLLILDKLVRKSKNQQVYKLQTLAQKF